MPTVTETIFVRNVFKKYIDFCPSLCFRMEKEGFMTSTAGHHQRMNEMLWLHFWDARILSIFIQSMKMETYVN